MFTDSKQEPFVSNQMPSLYEMWQIFLQLQPNYTGCFIFFIKNEICSFY